MTAWSGRVRSPELRRDGFGERGSRAAEVAAASPEPAALDGEVDLGKELSLLSGDAGVGECAGQRCGQNELKHVSDFTGRTAMFYGPEAAQRSGGELVFSRRAASTDQTLSLWFVVSKKVDAP